MNLLFLINEFFKKFINMYIILLINIFFKYNQISFIKKSCDIIMIMILINLF